MIGKRSARPCSSPTNLIKLQTEKPRRDLEEEIRFGAPILIISSVFRSSPSKKESVKTKCMLGNEVSTALPKHLSSAHLLLRK